MQRLKAVGKVLWDIGSIVVKSILSVRIVRWALRTEWVGPSLAFGINPIHPRDPTLRAISNILWMALVIFLWEVFREAAVVLIFIGAFKLLWQIQDEFRYVRDIRGFFWAVWRSLGVVLETTSFGIARRAVEKRSQALANGKPYLFKRLKANRVEGVNLPLPINLTPKAVDGVKELHFTPRLSPSQRSRLSQVEREALLKKIDRVSKEFLSLRDIDPSKADKLLKDNKIRVHEDFRFKDPETGLVHAFASNVRASGVDGLAIKVDAKHGHTELANPKEVYGDYGLGISRKTWEGKLAVWVSPKGNLHVVNGKVEEAFVQTKDGFRRVVKKPKVALDQVKPRDWPKAKDEIWGDPAKFKALKDNPKMVWERKEDGDYVKVIFPKEGRPMMIMRRGRTVNKVMTNEVIDNVYKCPDLLNPKLQEKYADSILECEAIPLGVGNQSTQRLYGSALLNSSPGKSLFLQEKHGKLALFIHRVERLKGEDLSHLDYVQMRQIREKTRTDMNKIVKSHTFHVAKRIPKNGIDKEIRLAETEGREGFVVQSMEGPALSTWFKYKLRQIRSSRIVKINPIKDPKSDKWKETEGAGTFLVEDGTTVPIRAMEGSTDDLRIEAMKNPDKFIGREVVYSCTEVFSSGKGRDPRLEELR